MGRGPRSVRELPDLPEPEVIRSGGVGLAVRRLGPAEPLPPLPPLPSASGPSADPPAGSLRLVALHGGPGLDHHVLLPLGLPLARRHEVWLVDLPGHGGSVAPSGRLPGLATLEGRLASWLRYLPDPVDGLVGHSLGAWLVARLLRRRGAPDGVCPRAAVLLAPPAAGQEGERTALRRAVRAVRGKSRPGRAGGGAERARWDRARRELLAHAEAETRGWIDPAFREALERTEVRDPREYGPLLRSFHRAVTGPVRPFDPGCPVLVLCGEEDRTTPPDQARRVARTIAGSRLDLLSGAGHYPFAERGDELARRIEQFLDALT